MLLGGIAPSGRAKGTTGCGATPQPTVTVWLARLAVAQSAGDALAIAYARRLAAEMFASIGVKLEWRSGLPGDQPACGETLAMDLALDPGASDSARFPASALAYATVGSQQVVAIHLFYNRIMSRRDSDLKRALLAHVMVHEITHVLEGLARHSSEGIMKANWDEADFKAMMARPLHFAPEDVRLVSAHFGMEGGSEAVAAR
jgi:hypothetical protein